MKHEHWIRYSCEKSQHSTGQKRVYGSCESDKIIISDLVLQGNKLTSFRIIKVITSVTVMAGKYYPRNCRSPNWFVDGSKVSVPPCAKRVFDWQISNRAKKRPVESKARQNPAGVHLRLKQDFFFFSIRHFFFIDEAYWPGKSQGVDLPLWE